MFFIQKIYIFWFILFTFLPPFLSNFDRKIRSLFYNDFQFNICALQLDIWFLKLFKTYFYAMTTIYD